MTSKDPQAPSLIVTLLHGTFAKDAPWVDSAGSIARALTARFGGSIVIESICWSGKNSFKGRRDATDLLRRHIVQPRPGMEEAAHVVIAHSHAGNIAAYAPRDAEVDAKLAGIVTMATPFIVARKRNLGHVGAAIGQALVLWLVLALYWVASTRLGPGFGSAQAAELGAGYKIALIFGIVVLVEVPGLLLVAAWRRSSASLLDDLAFARLDRDRLFILRAMADEASGAITVLQVPSLMTTLLFGRLAGATDAVVRWCERLVRRPLVAMATGLLFLIASMLPGGLVLWLTGSQLLMWVVMIAFMSLSYGPIVFLLLRNQHLAFVTAAGCLAIALVPALLIVSLASALAYGPRFALANLDLDISVESTPVGQYLVTLLSPAATGDPDTPGGLLHSALYDDERAIDLIGDYVEARLRSGRPHSRIAD